MKRLSIIIVAALMSIATASAQGYESTDILVGIKAGPTYTTLTGLGGKYKLGGTLGAYLEMYFTDNIVMDLEVAYNMKGSSDVPLLNSPEKLRNYDLHYLSATYMLKYSFNRHLGLYGGLNVSVLTYGKIKKDGQTMDLRDHLHQGDFGPVVGAEYVIGDKWTIDGRWMWSPRKIARDDLAYKNIGNTRNQTFTLTLGYKFQIF